MRAEVEMVGGYVPHTDLWPREASGCVLKSVTLGTDLVPPPSGLSL